MATTPISDEGTRDAVIKLLEQQVDLLLQVVVAVSQSDSEERAARYCIVPMAGSDTIRSICDLGRKGRVGDCLMLSRSVLEWAVNYCFLLVCDEEHAIAFERHSKQRQFRNLNRRVEAGQMGMSLAFSGTPDPSTVEGLQEALDAFTSRSGKEITRWTSLHLHDRIRIFSERTTLNALPLLALAFWVYDDASEILHGTLYGSLAAQGIHQPQATDLNRAVEARNESIVYVALVTLNVLDLIVRAIAEQVDLESLGVAHLAEFSAERNDGVVRTIHEHLNKHQATD